jgi:RloB-like protein
VSRREPISRLRDKASFRRRSGQKLPRSITLIVCEGETEQEYFEAVRTRYGLTTTEVVIAENTEGAAPISVVKCAEKKFSEPGGYDRIYCIFDRDGHESFQRARARIKALTSRKRKPIPIDEAVSIPCFEVWVLLHFESTEAPFGCCDDVIARVRKHLPDYKKADAAIARQLMVNVETALENADRLESHATVNKYNPYTSVHRVVRHFELVAGEVKNP